MRVCTRKPYIFFKNKPDSYSFHRSEQFIRSGRALIQLTPSGRKKKTKEQKVFPVFLIHPYFISFTDPRSLNKLRTASEEQQKTKKSVAPTPPPPSSEKQQDFCPSCGEAFDCGKKRRLIDSCGHERCYTCMFSKELCSLCTFEGKNQSYRLTRFDVMVIGGYKSVVRKFRLI